MTVKRTYWIDASYFDRCLRALECLSRPFYINRNIEIAVSELCLTTDEIHPQYLENWEKFHEIFFSRKWIDNDDIKEELVKRIFDFCYSSINRALLECQEKYSNH